ncbi:hypothetical protein HMPREF1556_01376 [Porphyromonas sp. oral taxon 278 str. W7784]|nr:hypothetical protein HMPREF1556_01376 [Porphyromonas sp. oral taxon 278 str. W7784]
MQISWKVGAEKTDQAWGRAGGRGLAKSLREGVWSVLHSGRAPPEGRAVAYGAVVCYLSERVRMRVLFTAGSFPRRGR